MRVLVTGAHGRVGRLVASELVAHGHSVIASTLETAAVTEAETTLACDLLDSAAVAPLVERAEPEAIVHVAASTGEVLPAPDIVAAFARRTGATAASLRFPFTVAPYEWQDRGRNTLVAPSQNSIFSYIDARDLARGFRLAVESPFDGYDWSPVHSWRDELPDLASAWPRRTVAA